MLLLLECTRAHREGLEDEIRKELEDGLERPLSFRSHRSLETDFLVLYYRLCSVLFFIFKEISNDGQSEKFSD